MINYEQCNKHLTRHKHANLQTKICRFRTNDRSRAQFDTKQKHHKSSEKFVFRKKTGPLETSKVRAGHQSQTSTRIRQ